MSEMEATTEEGRPNGTLEINEDVREGLASLLIYWYGNHRSIRDVIRGRDQDAELQELPLHMMEQAWRRRWFAKGDLTAPVDKYMMEEFSWLLDGFFECGKKDDSFGQSLLWDPHYHPKQLWEQMAVIILFDQLPRNIYRETKGSYEGDRIALPLALELSQRRVLPFHFRATIAICLCHSESLEVQDALGCYLNLSKTSKTSLDLALQSIFHKHRERIVEFGRFPERNSILQRKSTPRELAYLAQLR